MMMIHNKNTIESSSNLDSNTSSSLLLNNKELFLNESCEIDQDNDMDWSTNLDGDGEIVMTEEWQAVFTNALKRKELHRNINLKKEQSYAYPTKPYFLPTQHVSDLNDTRQLRIREISAALNARFDNILLQGKRLRYYHNGNDYPCF